MTRKLKRHFFNVISNWAERIFLKAVFFLSSMILMSAATTQAAANTNASANTNAVHSTNQIATLTLPNAKDFSKIETLPPLTKKVRVLVFLSARCPCSNSHIAELNSIVEDFPDVEMMGVHSNQDENRSLTENYFKNIGLKFSVYEDKGAKLADQYKAFKTPHAYVLNKNQEIIFQGGVSNSHELSRADRKYLREAIEDVLANRPVRTAKAKSLGCVISREEQ